VVGHPKRECYQCYCGVSLFDTTGKFSARFVISIFSRSWSTKMSPRHETIWLPLSRKPLLTGNEVGFSARTDFDAAKGNSQTLQGAAVYSSNTNVSSDLLIVMLLPRYSMKPSFLNLFMKRFTRERVEPIISDKVSWETVGSTPSG
jgi:hypothetical protein